MRPPPPADPVRRERAEARLAHLRAVAPLPADRDSIERLVDELHTYQVELELQNEELRRAEEEARHHRDRYLDLYDNAPVGYCTLDAQGNVCEANRVALDLLGEPRGLPCRALLGFVATGSCDVVRHVIEDGRKGRRGSCEAELSSPGGAWVRLDACRADPPASGAGELRVTLADITPRVRLEADRERVARKTIAMQESERRRLARDLHDGVNQVLAALRSRLASGHSGDGLLTMLDDAIEEVRRMARGLHPLVLTDLGLAAALRSLCRQVEDRSGARVSLDMPPGLPPMDEELEITIFRLVQETLTNVQLHAGAQHVDVALAPRGRALRLRVVDDGCGFDPGAVSGGLGLNSMRERVRLLGGSARVASRPGRGSEWTFDLPLRLRAGHSSLDPR